MREPYGVCPFSAAHIQRAARCQASNSLDECPVWLPAPDPVRDGVPPSELVDGDKLIDMFEKLELGLKTRAAFDIDDIFFEDFRK